MKEGEVEEAEKGGVEGLYSFLNDMAFPFLKDILFLFLCICVHWCVWKVS